MEVRGSRNWVLGGSGAEGMVGRAGVRYWARKSWRPWGFVGDALASQRAVRKVIDGSW